MILISDVGGKGFAIPKRYNCGSFKPGAPTYESRCQCDGQGERKKNPTFLSPSITANILSLSLSLFFSHADLELNGSHQQRHVRVGR